jgi:co-chaperonin GroES (HSP10)
MTIQMRHAVDPKKEILDKIGDLSTIEVMNANVLVGVYLRPAMTKGGVLVPSMQKEDKYQGKVGLVLAVGPLAFQNDGSTDFRGQQLQVGDWVVFRTQDGDALEVNGCYCRMLQDVTVRLKIEHPDSVY